MQGRDVEALYSLQKAYNGLAMQVAKAGREYVENEIKKRRKELEFLLVQKTNAIKHQANALSRSVKKTEKSISTFLS